MATKVVNGVRAEMTLEEEAAHIAAHPQRLAEIPEPSEAAVIMDALKAKRVLTAADLTAARKRLRP